LRYASRCFGSSLRSSGCEPSSPFARGKFRDRRHQSAACTECTARTLSFYSYHLENCFWAPSFCFCYEYRFDNAKLYGRQEFIAKRNSNWVCSSTTPGSNGEDFLPDDAHELCFANTLGGCNQGQSLG